MFEVGGFRCQRTGKQSESFKGSDFKEGHCVGSCEGFVHTTGYVTLTKELQYLAWVAVQGDPEHGGVCVGGWRWQGRGWGGWGVGIGQDVSLEVKEGMGRSLGR